MKNTLFTLLFGCFIIGCSEDQSNSINIAPSVSASFDGEFIELSNFNRESFTLKLGEATNSVDKYTLKAVLIQDGVTSEAVSIISTDLFPSEITVRPKNIISSLGLSEDDITMGDEIILYGIVMGKDGQEYAAYPNEDGNINSNFLIQNSQSYLFKLPIYCDFLLQDLTPGEYSVTFSSGNPIWSASTFQHPLSQNSVRLKDTDNPFRKIILMDYYGDFPIEFYLNFSCNTIMLSEVTDTQVGCGGKTDILYPRGGGIFFEENKGTSFSVAMEHEMTCLNEYYDDELVLNFNRKE